MIAHPNFRVEPWSLHETALNLEVLSQTESLFALSNGFIGVRGNLDEGEPHGIPGTYLNGVFELRPMPSAESQYGAPESSQTMIDVTNGKLIRLLVDDEPLDARYGHLVAHDRRLDFRAGTLTRTAKWCSPARRAVQVTSTRFVSFTHRARLRGARRERHGGDAHPPHTTQPAAAGRRDGPCDRRDDRAQAGDRDLPGLGARGGDRRPRAGAASPRGEVRGVRLVARADAAGGA
jgi:alpha,alpha-trehalose phosphorylase